MYAPRFGRRKIVTAGLLVAGLITAQRPATAGPGTYDPKTQQFTLSYTYARLPGVGVVGDPVRPSDQMDANVRSFFSEVDTILQVVTEGRGKLATPQLVDSTARADVVISPDNDSDRAAWATPGGFGKQGNVYIYYKYLADPSRPRTGVALTAVHELCHYIFDMPDEYPDSADGAPDRHCPPDPTGAGQGCLMDNYWNRPWYQHLCDHDHNTTVASARQNRRFPESCKSKVDAFFAQRGVVSGQTAEPGTSDSPAAKPATEAAKVQSVVQSVITRVRMNVNKIGLDKLRTIASELVKGGLKSQNLTSTESEVSNAVGVIMKAVSFVAMDPPAKFTTIAKLIKDAAVRIAKSNTSTDDASKIAAVKSELIKLAIAKAPPADGTGYSSADIEYLESEARSAVLAPPADNGKAKDKNDVLFQMLHYLFEATRDLSADSNPAVARVMSDRLRDLDKVGRDLGFAVPVRPRFGTRRTMIIAPDPKEGFDLIPLQSGVYSFKAMRDLYLAQFAKLIKRNSVEFNKIDLRQKIESEKQNAFGVPVDGAKEVLNEGTGPDQGGARPAPGADEATIAALLSAILDDIQKDQLENVAVLIPPGGFPGNLNDFLKTFRNQAFVRKSDIRLDVVTVGTEPIPSLLMDLVERSGGVVLTVSDIHETGAVAQRLKNEQSAGAWICVPRQFNLPCGKESKTLAQQLLGNAVDPAGGALAKTDYQTAKEALDAGLATKYQELVAKVRIKLERLTTEADNAAKVSEDKKQALEPAATAIRELRYGFLGKDDKATDDSSVVGRLKSLLPTVNRISVQFKQIPDIGATPAAGGLPDDPVVVQARKRQAGLRVLKDIADAKQVLSGIERNLRPALLVKLKALQATLEANKSDDKDAVATMQTLVDQLLKEDANELYNSLYSDVRMVERGVLELLQPVISRIDLANFQKQVRNLDPADPLTVDNIQMSPTERLYQIGFFGEEDAEYEVIVGLSHIPPFKIPTQQANFGTAELVKVELRDDKGSLSAYSDSLKLDVATSTPTMRVYRLPKVPGRKAQRFQLRVVPNTDFAGALLDDVVRYTVSVASLRPNVQLNAGIVYEPLVAPAAAQPKKLNETDADKLTPLTTIRGTFSALLPGPVVEVSVYGGTPILGASVKGLYLVLGKGNPLDKFPTIDFRDDGMTPDRAKDDGIYTAQIPLDATPAGGADFRMGIQAFATNPEQTKNVPFEPTDDASAKRTEDNAKTNKKADAGAPQETPPLLFQRATSVHFHVDP